MRNMESSSSGPLTFCGFGHDLRIGPFVRDFVRNPVEIDIRAVIARVLHAVVIELESARRRRLFLAVHALPLPLVYARTGGDGVDLTGFHVLPPILGTRSGPTGRGLLTRRRAPAPAESADPRSGRASSRS